MGQPRGGSDIGVRHLLAAYVIDPPAAHRRQIVQEWGTDELRWRQTFFASIAPRYTAEAWEDARQRAVPTKPVAAFEKFDETQAVKGKAVAFPGNDQTMAVLARGPVSRPPQGPVPGPPNRVVRDGGRGTQQRRESAQRSRPSGRRSRQSRKRSCPAEQFCRRARATGRAVVRHCNLSPRVLNG